MKQILMFSLFVILSVIRLKAQNADSDKGTFLFNEITFHSSKCNGTCPDISLEITSAGKISLVRTVFKKKGEVDARRSGTFKGILSGKEMSKLIVVLRAVNWDTVVFPKVSCCDAAIVQILLSTNGKYKKFKSMTPPEEVREVVAYLTDLAKKAQLPPYKGAIDFEEIVE